MTIKEAVVMRFNEICDARGFAKNKLANESGLTPSTVYSMMRQNRRDVSISTIKKLCDGLNITIREFFDDPIFDGLEQEIS